jgi:hypothetical protein
MDISAGTTSSDLSDRTRLRPVGRRSRPRSWRLPSAHEEVAARRSPCLDDLVGGSRPTEAA